MQTYEEIEASYNTPDPWCYQTTPDDLLRKEIILSVINAHKVKYGPFERALDIGAGEGWITKDLPAEARHGLEISKQARDRMPFQVTPVDQPQGKYDLVIATGVLYRHYDCQKFFRFIREHSTKFIITCNIADWEHPEMRLRNHEMSFLQGKEIFTTRFPYREYLQKLRVFYLG